MLVGLAACGTLIGTELSAAAPAEGGIQATTTAAGGTPARSTRENDKPNMAIRAREHVREGGLVPVHGVLGQGSRSRAIALQLRTPQGWHTVDRARASQRGRFSAAWRPQGPGRFTLRLRIPGAGHHSLTTRQLPERVNVYRSSNASWFGPGFYGRRTGCGRTLQVGTLGVAHRTLPCGTPVTFRHGGHTVTVPVIDRGPYSGGREWDLTGATKEALHFGSTGTVLSTR